MNEKHVLEFANMMKAGTFKYNAVPVIIGTDGTLLDGQHRLKAITKCGIPQLMKLVTNAPLDIMETIDCGRRRTDADLLEIHSVKNSRLVAAGIRVYLSLLFNIKTDEHGSGLAANLRPHYSKSDLMRLYNENDVLIDKIATKVSSIKEVVKKIMPKGAILGYTLFLNKEKKHDVDFILSFFKKLVGTDMDNSAVNSLRNKLVVAREDKRKGMTPRERTNLIAKAWNYYISGKTLKLLKFDLQRDHDIELL